MSWAEHIDLYCERTDASLWSEPLNALSNLGFLLVAVVLWKRTADRDRDLQLLDGLIFAIGLGSLTFHTLATRWAALLDIAFIALFVLVFHQRFQVRIRGAGNGRAWMGTALFVALATLFTAATRVLPPLPLNGSEIYLPPFALLLWCAATARQAQPAAARWLARAGGLFIISLTCRASDTVLCDIWPTGTHAGWHLVNALVLYCCLRALQLTPHPAPARPNTGL
ncbi:MAG: ceramidase domain-containing protein [Zoogloea sp.]|uniref:ceramidase domain-containing protein n=1 Tax=Zoogloea sp. TaxID=49181 RepID=UPI002603DBF5|nr:ceramidase domain-containing protein [Zoogloea sp.]MDD2988810.1 ceramidase domain-containing protein [Zoogloea sp.]